MPFHLPSQMTDICPKAEKHISRLTRCDINKLRLRYGDILLSRSGTIGAVALVSKTLDNTVFSDDVIRFTAKDNLSGYIYAYLRSPTGNTLLLTNNYGSAIQHIEPEHIDNILVPNPPDAIKERIGNLIMRSFEMRDKSNELLEKATALLVKELELPPLGGIHTDRLDDSSGVNAFSVKLSELAGRFDASHHLPIVKAITNHLSTHAAEVTVVGDKRVSKDIILPGRFKRVYVEKGHGRVFIGSKQINELDPYSKKYLSLTHHGDRMEKQLGLSENMTLITCSGTIGRVALVGRHWSNWTASQHIIRIVPADNDIAGYIGSVEKLRNSPGKRRIRPRVPVKTTLATGEKTIAG
jgi:type I restriction enzyme S subunit